MVQAGSRQRDVLLKHWPREMWPCRRVSLVPRTTGYALRLCWLIGVAQTLSLASSLLIHYHCTINKKNHVFVVTIPRTREGEGCLNCLSVCSKSDKVVPGFRRLCWLHSPSFEGSKFVPWLCRVHCCAVVLRYKSQENYEKPFCEVSELAWRHCECMKWSVPCWSFQGGDSLNFNGWLGTD